MKKTFRWFLVGFAVLISSMMTLAACHRSHDNAISGSGGGGTGASTFSRGIVATQNNQQNMSLNGVQFGTGTSNVTMNGTSGSAGDLRMGQIVTLRGNALGANGTASTIIFNNEMTGPITSISNASSAGTSTGPISSATFTMFGQTVTVDGNTLFQSDDVDLTNLQPNMVVEVSGMPDGTGNLIATFINSRPTATLYNVRGIVSNVSGSTFTLTPNGNGNPLTVTLGPGATVTNAAGGATGAGAGGTVTGGTGTTTGAGGTVTGGTGTTTGAGGTITGGTGTTTGAGGTVTGGTGTTTGTGAGTGGTTGGLANGQFVDVKIDPATYTPGSTTITARSVIIENSLLPTEGDTVFLEGFASNATGTNAGGNRFQVDGITVNAGSNTVPPAGSRVAVHGTFTNGVLNADLVQPAAGSQLTVGSISSITGTAATGAGAGGTTTGTTGTAGTGLGTGGTTTTGGGTGGTTTGSTSVQQVSCPASGTTNITIQDFQFTPANASVPANSVVKWTNNGPSLHTVTSTGATAFDSGSLAAGNSVCFQFPTAGTFNYFCSIHPFMTGSVTVTGTGAGTTTGAGAGGTVTTGTGTSGTGTGGTTGTVRMVVNGNTFDISTAKIKMNGQPAGIADLQPGKQVIVKAFSNNFSSILFPGTAGTGGTTATSATGLGTGGTSTTGTTTGTAGTGGAVSTGTGTAAGFGTTGTSGSPLYPAAGGVSSGGTITTGTGAGGTTAGTGVTGTGAGGTATTSGTGTTGATGAGTGGTSTGLVLKAVTVWIIDNIQGPATSISGALSSASGTTSGTLTSTPTATFTVFGQTILVNGNTRFGSLLQGLISTNTGSLAGLDTSGTNPVIDASGIPDNVGDLIATFLESSPTATEYHVRGIVSASTGSPLSTFTLTPVPNGAPLTVTLASSATVTNVTDGMTVNVRIDPTTFNAGNTTITAKAVDPVKEPIPSQNDLMSVEGIVASDGTIMTALGIPINVSSASTSGLQPGSRVIVQGTMSNGSLLARQVSNR